MDPKGPPYPPAALRPSRVRKYFFFFLTLGQAGALTCPCGHRAAPAHPLRAPGSRRSGRGTLHDCPLVAPGPGKGRSGSRGLRGPAPDPPSAPGRDPRPAQRSRSLSPACPPGCARSSRFWDSGFSRDLVCSTPGCSPQHGRCVPTPSFRMFPSLAGSPKQGISDSRVRRVVGTGNSFWKLSRLYFKCFS